MDQILSNMNANGMLLAVLAYGVETLRHEENNIIWSNSRISLKISITFASLCTFGNLLDNNL